MTTGFVDGKTPKILVEIDQSIVFNIINYFLNNSNFVAKNKHTKEP